MSAAESNFDAWLDAQLRDVPLPEGLLERLRGLASLSDEQLDAALRDVPVPSRLMARLDRVGQRWSRLEKVGRWATAVSLLVAFGMTYFGLVTSFLVTERGSATRLPSWGYGGPPDRLTVQLVEDEPAVEPGGALLATETDTSPQEADEFSPRIPQFALPADAGRLGKKDSLRVGLPRPEGLDLLESVALAQWPNVRAYPSGIDEVEDLKKVPSLKPRGIDCPLVFGYDLVFLSRTGFHPFVCPALNPALRSMVVPLSAETASYDLLRRYLEDGELPPRQELRTEDFLAALDYPYPRPDKQSLGLLVAGGPSPFRGSGLQLLLCGVQARDLAPVRRAPARLTLAVDISGSMSWGGRLDMVREAMAWLCERMLPEDRISLVVFNADGFSVVEDAGPLQRDQLLAAVDALRPSGLTNVAAGLRSAYAVALREPMGPHGADRVILFTDGLAALDHASASQISARLAEAAKRGAMLHVVDMSQGRDQDDLDPSLLALAQKGGGRVHRATTVHQIRWALEEILTGRPQQVAADAQLKVSFHPKAVAWYRLLGHEPRTVAALKPAPAETDFCAGQAATVLFELMLLPKGAEEVALAELTWRDPQSGQVHRAAQTFSRSQFAAYLFEAPLPLQAATMVAEAAEILRLSPFHPAWPNAASLEPVLRMARQVDARVLREPSYRVFLEVLEKAASVRPARSGGEPRFRSLHDRSK